MCGRFVIISAPAALRERFRYRDNPNFPPRYNVAPTQPVPVVMNGNGDRIFRLMRWGLLPSWVKDPSRFTLLINARSETILEKPAFRNAFRRRRGLIPADGYYEWQDLGSRKQPLFIRPRDGRPIAFAAIAETWSGPNGEELDTVAIITTGASHELTGLHPRVPVTIAHEHFEHWLDCSNDEVDHALALLRPPEPEQFVWYPISTAVNRVVNDAPELIAPLTDEQVTEEAKRAPPRERRKADDRQGSLFD